MEKEEVLAERFVRKDGCVSFKGPEYSLGRDWAGQHVRIVRRNGTLTAINESGERRTCIKQPLASRLMFKCKKCKKLKFIYARGLCQTCYGEEARELHKGEKSKFLDGRAKKGRCRRCGRMMILDGMGHCRNCGMTVASTRAKSRKRNGRIRNLEKRVQELETEVRNLKETLQCEAARSGT